jgi:hypothetical protein
VEGSRRRELQGRRQEVVHRFRKRKMENKLTKEDRFQL